MHKCSTCKRLTADGYRTCAACREKSRLYQRTYRARPGNRQRYNESQRVVMRRRRGRPGEWEVEKERQAALMRARRSDPALHEREPGQRRRGEGG